MKTKILTILATIFMLTGCELNISDNGVLEGSWQMTELQWTGEPPVDMRETLTMWGFQFEILEMRSAKATTIFYRFDHNQGTLTIHTPRYNSNSGRDQLITDPAVLRRYGITDPTEKFVIETANGNNLVLRSDSVRLSFRKY